MTTAAQALPTAISSAFPKKLRSFTPAACATVFLSAFTLSLAPQARAAEPVVAPAPAAANAAPNTAALAAALAAAPAPASNDGKKQFESICGGCHQPSGAGVAGMYPPLASRLAPWLATAAGREYVGNVVLGGYFGALKVADKTYNGFMPTFGHLKSEDLAAILSYVGGSLNTPAEGYQAFTAADIDAYRAAPKRGAALTALRDSLPKP